MTRFYGEVGYGSSVEYPYNSGVYVDQIVEVSYYGNVIRNTRRLTPGENLNEDVSVGNSISIVADQYAIQNFMNIRYVKWSGVLWTVPNVAVQAPRLILDLGEVYNGPTPGSPPNDG